MKSSTPKLQADPALFVTKIHDATPQIVTRFALNDEQAILARIRYASSSSSKTSPHAYSQLAGRNTSRRIDVEKLVHAVLEQYPQLSATAECNERIEIRSPLLPVLGHEPLLAQALFNLLSKACKFIAPGAQANVVVRTEAAGEDVRIWVEDNGIGIAPEHRERLFKLFGRIHPDHKYEGTGVGLAVVKKAAERMGGTVGCESELGKGSRFWIQLKRNDSRVTPACLLCQS